MSHRVSRRLSAPGLGALALLLAAPAQAADLAYPPYPEPGPRRVYREERIEERVGELPPPACRMVLKRRIDEFGEEVVRRVRVCDDAPGYGPPIRPSFHRPPPADLPVGPPHDEEGWQDDAVQGGEPHGPPPRW